MPLLTRSLTRTLATSAVLVAAVLASGSTAQALSPTPLAASVIIPQELRDTVREKGTARVIVTLDVPMTPGRSKSGAGPLRPDAASRDLAAERAAGAANAAQASVRSRLGRTAKDVMGMPGAPFVSMIATEADLAALASAPEVRAVVPDRVLSAEAVSSLGGARGVQLPLWWHQKQIGLDWTHANGWTGRGQRVAIIDSGVDKTHAALRGRVVNEACFATKPDGTGACPGNQPWLYNATAAGVAGAGMPCTYSVGCAHGTHVAHIAAGQYGAAPSAGIVAIQAAHPELVNGVWVPKFNWSDILRALWYVYEPYPYTVAAVNLSIGGDQQFVGDCTNVDNTGISGYITSLAQIGTATVIASGNSNFTGGVAFPACLGGAITVGNSTLTSVGGADALFAQVGSGSNSGTLVDLLAPGTDICSAVPVGLDADGTKDGWACDYVGTSMAAPQVAGAYAVMRQSKPTASVQTIFTALNRRGTAVTDTRNGVTRTRIAISTAVYYW